MLYHGITVEHSYNCMVLLCRLFLGLSGHYTKKAEKQWEYIGNSFNDVTFAPNKYSEIYVCAFIDDDNSKMIPFLLPLETIKHGPDNSITNPRFAGASLYNGWALLHYNDGLIRMQSSSAGSTSIYVYGR